MDYKLWQDDDDTVINSLIIGLVAQQANTAPAKRKRDTLPGAALFTAPPENTNIKLSPQAIQACNSAILSLKKTANRLNSSLGDMDNMREKWTRCIGHKLFIVPTANKSHTLSSVISEIRTLFKDSAQDIGGKLLMDLCTYLALFYFYQVSSIGVTDHKAVQSIRTMEELVETSAEGFLVQRFDLKFYRDNGIVQ